MIQTYTISCESDEKPHFIINLINLNSFGSEHDKDNSESVRLSFGFISPESFFSDVWKQEIEDENRDKFKDEDESEDDEDDDEEE